MSNTTTSTTPTYSLNPLELLPSNSNQWLAADGDIALYNEILLVTATALFQHTAVFGTVFLLRGFSSKRALDLHFLTIIFALSFVFAPLVFLFDQTIDSFKLWFFLDHEAIEYLIAIVVLAPKSIVKKYPGLIVFLCWTVLSCMSIVVAWNRKYHHGADIVAWGAFGSDFLVAVSGLVLIKRWLVARWRRRILGTSLIWQSLPEERFRRRKIAAEAMAGLGFMLHGITTMSVGPIFTRVLYYGLNPTWFAYVWVVVFSAALFTVALSVPVASIFCSTINWCCWHDRKILPGQAHYDGEADVLNRTAARPGILPTEHEKLSFGLNSYAGRINPPRGSGRRCSSVRPGSNLYWTRLAQMHAAPSEEDRRLAEAYCLR